GLKVGDTIHSYMYGDGVVKEIIESSEYPIVAYFCKEKMSFTSKGFWDENSQIPCIHLYPWNPIQGEPFPFPKWEPIVGEVYAFWDDKYIDDNWGFIVAKFG